MTASSGIPLKSKGGHSSSAEKKGQDRSASFAALASIKSNYMKSQAILAQEQQRRLKNKSTEGLPSNSPYTENPLQDYK